MADYIKIQGIEEKANGVYYRVKPNAEPIGIGGMGRVYKGECVSELSGQVVRDVAVKFIYDDLPEDSDIVRRAKREASIQLRNDNLVEMLGFIVSEDCNEIGEPCKHYHVVSELLDGVTLQDFLDGKLVNHQGLTLPFAEQLYKDYLKSPEDVACKIVEAVLSGIRALHDEGYIHRDIDPSNIMLTSDGRIKLIDFGIAKKKVNLANTDSSYTISGQFIGKAKYASPEQVYGDVQHQDETTDIYAIGILFFQMITGHVPFDGPTVDVLEMQVKKKLPLKEIKNGSLRRIIAKATAKRQADRFLSASEFRVALDHRKAFDGRFDVPDSFLWGGGVVVGLVAGMLLALFI